MHCRPFCTNHDTTCSSFLFAHSNYSNTLNHSTCSPVSIHDQIPSLTATPHRRRRLEDLIVTYASNHYATCPSQASSLSPQSSQTPLVTSSHQIFQQSQENGIYCDLFNLLERPSQSPPPVKQRRKYTLNDYHSRRRHASIAYRSAHAKMKDINERKRHHYQEQKSSYFKEKKHHEDELSPMQQCNPLRENSKNRNSVYQQNSPSKGFFRRVARNYFCMPMTVTNAEFSN